jgi:hypothetical protein
MTMDLVFRNQKNRKGLATSQGKVLSPKPAFQQTVSISVCVKADIQSIRSNSSVKIFLLATKYFFIP